jgi:hypothetical protein
LQNELRVVQTSYLRKQEKLVLEENEKIEGNIFSIK